MEYFDICDKDGHPTGEIVSRQEAHRLGIRHRTAHVWIARRREGRWEVLLQKRSANKDSFPGLYDTSSAGHVPAGAEPLDSALRELEEELGLRAQPGDLIPIGHFDIHYEKRFRGELFRDNEYTHVFLYRGNVDERRLTLQAEEVERVDWFDLQTVAEEIRVDRSRFCVPSEGLGLVIGYLSRHPLP